MAGSPTAADVHGQPAVRRARTAVVTGAGRNIGRATALALAQDGVEVLLVGRTEAPLRESADLITSAGGRAHVCTADVGSPDHVKRVERTAIRLWRHVDILVNNAGVSGEPPLFDLDVGTYRRIFDTNVLGTLLMSQAIGRHMAKRRQGVIIHIGSVDASGADGNSTAYSASKAAIISLTRTMAVELAAAGVRVNCVSPGWVYSDAYEHDDIDEHVGRHMLHDFVRVPSRRAVHPDEVAAAVLFLASAGASGFAGANLVVDGGLTSNLFVVETLPVQTRPDVAGRTGP